MNHLISITVLACVLLQHGSAASSAEDNEVTPPFNLLIIQTDEHHFGTLGCYGGEIVGTPNIDWIAQHGVRCDSFYAVTPVCTPSRGSMVTGLYPQKTGVLTNNVPMPDEAITFATVLARNGYATGFAGKWHLDGSGRPQWAPERQFGFEDNRFMFNRGHWKNFEDTASGPRVGPRNAQGLPTYAVDDADETTFSTDWLCNKVIDFVRANQDNPFCYYVSLPDPHGPNTVRSPYDTMYADVEIPIPETLRPKNDEELGWRRSNGVNADALRRIMPAYYGMVRCIDDNVGRIIDELRELELLDHTIIVFTSDHGDLCGEHGRLNKGVPYEGSARIPFLLCCPREVSQGIVVDEALTTVDFLPTILSLMSVEHDLNVDGRDASPLMRMDSNVEWDDFAALRSTPGNNWLCAVTAEFKLIVSDQTEPWLIDRTNDPTEMTNLWDDERQVDVRAGLARRLQAYAVEHHDPYARSPRIQQALRSAEQ